MSAPIPERDFIALLAKRHTSTRQVESATRALPYNIVSKSQISSLPGGAGAVKVVGRGK